MPPLDPLPAPTRRGFTAGLAGAFGLGGLAAGLGGLRRAARGEGRAIDGLGPLIPDPAGLFDLPAGFEYARLSEAGAEMDDGLLVPPRHDGMAAFAGEGGRVVLVRNHENLPGEGGAFGPGNARRARLEAERMFDPGKGGVACLGGTTTVVWDPAARRVERHHLSLAGTLLNCAGGATPWGSWISCEETTARASDALARDHGYCFEVPASAEGPVEPAPLVALGRFKHEAVAVDPSSGCLYLTEDMSDGLFYRCVPASPGDLRAGGRLQALRVRGADSADARNWHALAHVPPGEPLAVDWIDLEDVEAPRDDLRQRGFLAGAARFARGEGVHFAGGSVWFACTTGGRAKLGQIWRYQPSAREGTPEERAAPATLTLFLEPADSAVLQNCDNLCGAPWGHLVVCEDGPANDRLLGVTPEGGVYAIGLHSGHAGEIAGSTFSPDGSTLFVNLQESGITLAITGPWERARDV